MRRAGTIATTAVMAGVALLAWRAVRTEPASRAGASPAVEARLDQVIPEIDFRGIPFDQAIATENADGEASIGLVTPLCGGGRTWRPGSGEFHRSTRF